MTRRGAAAALVLALMMSGRPSSAAALCIGDCDDDGRVTVDELIRGVTIALGVAETETCPEYACTAPGCVVIDLLVGAVDSALHGCAATPLPTATPTPIEPTITPTPNPDPVIAALESMLLRECHLTSGVPTGRAVRATQHGYVVECMAHVSAHETVVDLVRYANADAASTAFAEASREGDPLEFQGLPAAYWETPFHQVSQDGARRYFVWQL